MDEFFRGFGARTHYGSASPPSAGMSADPNGGGHAEPRHPVEHVHVAADLCLGPLIGQSPSVKPPSDDGFVTSSR
jgi:hypothetical protein